MPEQTPWATQELLQQLEERVARLEDRVDLIDAEIAVYQARRRVGDVGST